MRDWCSVPGNGCRGACKWARWIRGRNEYCPINVTGSGIYNKGRKCTIDWKSMAIWQLAKQTQSIAYHYDYLTNANFKWPDVFDSVGTVTGIVVDAQPQNVDSSQPECPFIIWISRESVQGQIILSIVLNVKMCSSLTVFELCIGSVIKIINPRLVVKHSKLSWNLGQSTVVEWGYMCVRGWRRNNTSGTVKFTTGEQLPLLLYSAHETI